MFKKEQIAYDFGNVRIGGNPGENPTVLIGGLFFKDQPIVLNSSAGVYDPILAKEWVDAGTSVAEKTGHPLVIQVFGLTANAMEKHLSWLADNFEGTFMFESTDSKARKRGIEFCDDAGLSDRAIYNSINPSTKSDELKQLKNSSLNMAVVLGWSPKATSLQERMETIKTAVETARNSGIEKMVIDPATMPIGAGYGLDLRTVLAIKSELGLPTCLGPHNAPSAWKFIKQVGFDDEPTRLSAIVASTVIAQLMATDCVMYGSMARSKEVFTSVALVGNAISSAVAESNRVLGIDRPLFEPITFE
ncbi:MAG: hypothetical protein ACTSU3_11330 [Candidatus Thorarchaeota archaeon]